MRLVVCLVLALTACQHARPSTEATPTPSAAPAPASSQAVVKRQPGDCELDSECPVCAPPGQRLCLRPWVGGEHLPGQCRCQ